MRSVFDIFDENFDESHGAPSLNKGTDEQQDCPESHALENQVVQPTPIDIDALEKSCFEAGLRQGRAERASFEDMRLRKIVEQIVDPIKSVLDLQDGLIASAIEQTHEVALKMVGAVLPSLVATHGIGELAYFLDALAPVMRATRQIEIAANDGTSDAIRQLIGNERAAKICWRTLDDAENGDVKMTWMNGAAERNAGEILSRVEKLLNLRSTSETDGAEL